MPKMGSANAQIYPPGDRPYRVDISRSISAAIIRVVAKVTVKMAFLLLNYIENFMCLTYWYCIKVSIQTICSTTVVWRPQTFHKQRYIAGAGRV